MHIALNAKPWGEQCRKQVKCNKTWTNRARGSEVINAQDQRYMGLHGGAN